MKVPPLLLMPISGAKRRIRCDPDFETDFTQYASCVASKHTDNDHTKSEETRPAQRDVRRAQCEPGLNHRNTTRPFAYISFTHCILSKVTRILAAHCTTEHHYNGQSTEERSYSVSTASVNRCCVHSVNWPDQGCTCIDIEPAMTRCLLIPGFLFTGCVPRPSVVPKIQNCHSCDPVLHGTGPTWTQSWNRRRKLR